MKFQYTALALAACLSTAVAQGMEGLPDCAKDCASSSIPDHCKLIDVGCICGDKSFITNISCCVAKSCSGDNQEATIKFAHQICKGAGITDLPQSASCDSGAQSTATDKSTSSATTDSKSTKTASGASASTTASSASASTTDASVTEGAATSSKTGGSTGSSTSTNSPATTTAGAAHLQTKDTGVLAAIGAALFAFLV